MIEAILWRHQNGAKWRALLAEFGPWWMAQTFIRWARLGIWQKLLILVQEKRRQSRPDIPLMEPPSALTTKQWAPFETVHCKKSETAVKRLVVLVAARNEGLRDGR